MAGNRYNCRQSAFSRRQKTARRTRRNVHFRFPEGLSPNIPAHEFSENELAQAIAEASRNLNDLRDNWLNPPEWVERIPEVVEGYPERLIPKNEDAAKQLKKRNLTNLYDERPTWLDNAHRQLDEAVAAAYGFSADIPDDVILAKLLEMNLNKTDVVE